MESELEHAACSCVLRKACCELEPAAEDVGHDRDEVPLRGLWLFGDGCLLDIGSSFLIEARSESSGLLLLSVCTRRALLECWEAAKGAAWVVRGLVRDGHAAVEGLMSLGVDAAAAAAASCHLAGGPVLVPNRFRRTWLHFSGDASDALYMCTDMFASDCPGCCLQPSPSTNM